MCFGPKSSLESYVSLKLNYYKRSRNGFAGERIGIVLGPYWGGIAQVIDVITVISALGAIGGLPALLNALTKYTRVAMRQLLRRQSRTATTSAGHAFCNRT
jgi:hypothetical protein